MRTIVGLFAALTFISQSSAAEGPKVEQPVFPYGAVYFRKSNPPEQDWARDHKTAARIGMNTFRHWFMWSAIEVAPGKYDWRDYDRMMDLAAQNGIKVVIAELVTAAPEWMFHKYPQARYLASDGTVVNSSVGGSSATGGFPGLCLDNPEVKAAAEKFLAALAEHYRNHPALLGYDLWNENTYNGGNPRKMYCYCDATKRKMREWLRGHYGTLEKTGQAWNRYSYSSWEDVDPPYDFGGYTQSLDWLQFRIDNVFDLLHWRTKLFREHDSKHLIIAHGVAGTLDSLPSSAHDEWRSAAEVDTWGFTFVASRKGDEPWKQYQAVDLVRGGSRGKPFWHAEAEGGPLWMQPQVIRRPRDDGRIPDDTDVRLWNLVSCAGGATGILYPRWRPLLDGPLFGAFGPFGMDGSVTPRAEMAGKFATWANAHPDVWKSHPVKGDIGLVFAPESEMFNYVQQGDTEFYAQSIKGAYQAFFDSNIQADFVSLDDLAQYKIVYLPYPVMLKKESVNKLRAYVEAGGTLISEGLPAYFGDEGRAGATQPNLGFDQLFGAREQYVEFTPDLLDKLTLEVNGHQVNGRYFLQEYTVAGGKAVGHYANGHVAAVENQVGKGRTLLVGTFPGAGYALHHSPDAKAFYAELLKMANVQPQIHNNNPDTQARLHSGPGGSYLWITNPTRSTKSATVSIDEHGPQFHTATDVWGNSAVAVSDRRITVTLAPRDGAVIALR
ncbi:MAG TPA: beta-galactosidase [Bryobacteraceae bacterium]|nr:beta-galactosidase [Bryobacteraceae bacterium]